MAWHTVSEAQKLTGKSRRTLYRDMAAGRLSWAPEGDNGRRLETSELIRVYGPLLPVAQPGTEEVAHRGTPDGTGDTALILAELRALRAEVADLRQTLYLIEHKPAPEPVAHDMAQPQSPQEAPEMAHDGTPEPVPQAKERGAWWRPLWPFSR